MPPKKKKADRQLGPDGRANEMMIRDLMKVKKRKGNPKDYVILVGTSMFDAYGLYPIKRVTDAGVDGMVLLHKKNLHRFIGDEHAARFWNRKLAMRVPNKTREKTGGKARRQTR